jgi:rhodanese-related sulfurtransferase
MFECVKRYFVVLAVLCTQPLLAQQVRDRDLSVTEFKAKLESSPEAVLLDLRTPDELKKGIIPNAKNIDYFNLDFEKQIAALDKDKTYLLYCAVGGRSTETADLMTKLGFRKVYNLKEGFNGWSKKKMPVAKPQ